MLRKCFQVSPAEDIAAFVFMIFYLFPMVLQIFLPCYYGNDVSEASNNLSNSLFHAEWLQTSKRFKTAMKLFMENTKRQVIISAADGFFFVNLAGFLKICNLAYSVFALLQRKNK